MESRFQRADTYFFHNTVYGRVYKDSWHSRPLATEELLRRNPETRLLIVGDAAMAPEELLAPGGAITWGIDNDDADSSLRWLERLRARFRHSVWLNPIPKEDWPEAYGRATIQPHRRRLPHGRPDPRRHQAGGRVFDPGVRGRPTLRGRGGGRPARG